MKLKVLLIAAIFVTPLFAKDGVFTGVGTGGKRGNITVQITVVKNKVTAIEVTETKEDRKKAYAPLSAAIIKGQTTKVDTIAGATITSKAFFMAVNNAAKKAGLDLSK